MPTPSPSSHKALGRRHWPTPETIERQVNQRIAAYKASFKTGGPKRLSLIAHGDSWFDYPVGDDKYARTDITIWLERELIAPRPRLARIAHWGDTMDNLLGTKKRTRLINALEAGPADAILFSGGGNDIIGDEFHQYLNEASSVGHDPSKAINEPAFKHVMGTILLAYRDLVAIRDKHGPAVPIFINGYDFARPTNIGVCGGVVGPWLFPALKARGWMSKPKGTDLDKGVEIVRRMLQRFGAALQTAVVDKSKGVYLVETQGTIKQPGLWHNETHLKGEGFKQVARRFSDELTKRILIS